MHAAVLKRRNCLHISVVPATKTIIFYVASASIFFQSIADSSNFKIKVKNRKFLHFDMKVCALQ